MPRMLDFRERTKLRKAMYAKPTILILVLLTFLIGRGALGMYQKSIEAQTKKDKAVAELQRLEKYESELNSDISRLSTERGQESEIRDRFMVAKEGEKVIVVTNEQAEATHTVTVSEEPETMVNKLKASIESFRQ